MNGFIRRLGATEETISELEDWSEDNIQTEPWRDKKMYEYTIEERERHIDEVRRFKMHVIRATEI